MQQSRVLLMAQWWSVLHCHRLWLYPSPQRHHVYAECEELEVTLDTTSATLPRSTIRSQCKALREAIELVSIFALVDHKAWVHGLLSTANAREIFCAERGAYRPRFTLRFEAVRSDGTLSAADSKNFIEEVMAHIFASLELHERSNEYRETRTELLAGVICSELRDKCVNMRVPVVLKGCVWSTEVLDFMQTQAEGVYRRQHQGSIEGVPNCQLVLDVVDQCVEYVLQSQEHAPHFGMHLAQRQVPLRKVTVLGREDAASIICGAAANSMPYQHDSLGSSLSLVAPLDTEDDTIKSFSSIAANRTLQSLDISLFQNSAIPESVCMEILSLKWAAFAALSSYSRNSVHSFDIETNALTIKDAAVIADVLSAKNPLQVLLNSSEPMCKTSNLLVDVCLDQRGGLGPSVVIPAGSEVWIVHDRPTDTFVEVLVPGYGVCCLDQLLLDVPSIPAPKSPISHLSILMWDHSGVNDGFAGLVPVIEAVGSQLTSLSVQADARFKLASTDIAMILRACPRLKRLHLQGIAVEDLDFIVDSYEAGHCTRLQSVSLRRLTLGKGGANRFLEALKGPDSIMSRRLVEFELDTTNLMQDARVAANLETALAHNQHLQVVFGEVHSDLFETATSALMNRLSSDKHVMKEPLPLRSKLAFLSALTQSSSTIHKVADRLDSGVSNIIFGFAAPAIKRVTRLVKRY